MPFTLAHPAIFIPFNKRIVNKLSITGLIAGSMIPDFEFYLKLQTGENIGHHWYGIILFDIPMALILSLVYHQLIKENLINHLPAYYRKRLIVYQNINWLAYLLANKVRVLLSVIIGILSHLALDSFTHADGLAATTIPTLQSSIILMSIHLPLYFILQLLSSVMGLIMVWSFWKSLPEREISSSLPDNEDLFWMPLTVISFSMFTLKLLTMNQEIQFWDLFMAAVGSLVYGLVILGISKKINFMINLQVE